jgi:hypothetical protein
MAPSDFDPWEEACGERHGVLLLLPLALVYWLVIPLLALLVALPFTLVRSLLQEALDRGRGALAGADPRSLAHDVGPCGEGGRRDRRRVVARL